MINIIIPQETTFDLPEGNYAAKIDSVKHITKQTSKGIDHQVRFLFRVHVPEMEHVNTLAGRNFKLSLDANSDLRLFLAGLLGPKFFINGSGKPFDIETLIGKECEVELKHFLGRNHDKPMVIVASIHPRLSLEVTQAISARGEY